MSWSEISTINNELTIPLNTLMYINFCCDKLLSLDSEADVLWAFKSLEQNKILGLCFYYLSGSKYPALKKFGTFNEIMKDDEALSIIASDELIVSAIVMTGENGYGDIFSKNQVVQDNVLNNSKSFEALNSEKYLAKNFIGNSSLEYLKKIFASKEAVDGFCKSPWALYWAILWENKDKYNIFNDCTFITEENAMELNKTAYYNKDILKLYTPTQYRGATGYAAYLGNQTEYLYSYKDKYSYGDTLANYNSSTSNMCCMHFIYAYSKASASGNIASAYCAVSSKKIFETERTGYTFKNICVMGGLKVTNTVAIFNVFGSEDNATDDYRQREKQE